MQYFTVVTLAHLVPGGFEFSQVLFAVRPYPVCVYEL